MDLAKLNFNMANTLRAIGEPPDFPYLPEARRRYNDGLEAFSTEMPATVQRMRPGLYRFDVELFGGPVTMASDGEKAWMQGAGLGMPDGGAAPPGWSDNFWLCPPV